MEEKELKELTELYKIAKCLGEGKDPFSNLEFSQDTILNNAKILQYNKKMADILIKMIKTIEKSTNHIDWNFQKTDFILNEQEKQAFECFEEPVSISKLVYSLNGVYGASMKKLHAVDITSWLVSRGYLEQREMENGNKYKIATKSGNEIGIINEKHVNSYGNHYNVNKYDIKAQRFIINHINEILGVR